MRKILFVILAATALTACNQGGAGGGLGGVAAPVRKPGLWQIVSTNDGKPMTAGPFTGPVKLCMDAATDRRMSVFGRRRGTCDSYKVSKGSDGSYTVDAVCQFGSGAKITSHTVVTGDFNTKYSSTSDTTRRAVRAIPTDGKHQRQTTATYLGDCPAGMTGGQIQTADGTIMEMPTGRGGGGGGGGGGERRRRRRRCRRRAAARVGAAAARRRRRSVAGRQTRSTATPATASPPPMQSEARPRFSPRAASGRPAGSPGSRVA